MNRRLLRINDRIQRELSDLLIRQVKDPRLASMITITAVETSTDLRFARVFISVLGTDEEKKTVLSGLRSATRFLRRELGERIDIRRIPDLTWVHDDSIERGARILAILEGFPTGGGEAMTR